MITTKLENKKTDINFASYEDLKAEFLSAKEAEELSNHFHSEKCLRETTIEQIHQIAEWIKTAIKNGQYSIFKNFRLSADAFIFLKSLGYTISTDEHRDLKTSLVGYHNYEISWSTSTTNF